jgi:hypothetical protein
MCHDDPVQVWHQQIREYNIGSEFSGETQTLGPTICLADYFKVSLRFQNGTQTSPLAAPWLSCIRPRNTSKRAY